MINENVCLGAVGFPNFKYGVFERPEGVMLSFISIDHLVGRRQSTLVPDSAPLADKVAFYRIGRDLESQLESVREVADDLPDPVKRIGRALYAHCQKMRKDKDMFLSVIHKDALLVEPKATIPGNPRPGKDYVAVRYFQNIEAFSRDLRDVVVTPETIEERLWLPGSGAILPTEGQNTKFGLPQATGDRNEAVKAFASADLGLTEETAKSEVSDLDTPYYQGFYIVRSAYSCYNGALGICFSELDSSTKYPCSGVNVGFFNIRRWVDRNVNPLVRGD